jgi:hypothetical protein
MDNPYSPPQSDVEVINASNSMSSFKRFSAWWVFLLTFVTFGIYTMYWLYTRSVTINNIHHRRISDTAIWGTIITYVISTAISFLPSDFSANLAIVGLIGTFAYLFFFLWWLYAVRNRLQEMIDENGGPDFRIGPIMTFFFQSIYLQYKINEQIDQQAQGTSAERVVQVSAG